MEATENECILSELQRIQQNKNYKLHVLRNKYKSDNFHLKILSRGRQALRFFTETTARVTALSFLRKRLSWCLWYASQSVWRVPKSQKTLKRATRSTDQCARRWQHPTTWSLIGHTYIALMMTPPSYRSLSELVTNVDDVQAKKRNIDPSCVMNSLRNGLLE